MTGGKCTANLNVRVQSTAMGRRTKRAAVAAVGLGLVWPAVAWADEQIQADPSNRYSTPEITIDQGEKVTSSSIQTFSGWLVLLCSM